MAAVAAGATFASADARADVSGSSSPNVSTGTAALRYEHNKAIDTNLAPIDWKKTYTPFGNGWPITVGLKALIRLDPVKNGGPLFTVDMPKGAIVEASWANDKKFVFKAANGSTTDGNVKVRHSLSPDIDITAGIGSIQATLTYDANKLVNKIPGAKFDYDSQAIQQFAPWGLATVDTKLNSPVLAQAKLFSMPFSDVTAFDSNINQYFDGEFGIQAITKPTFSYKTSKVAISGADGIISAVGGQVTMPAVDGDFLDLTTAVEGEMNVAGDLVAQGFVNFTAVPNPFDDWKKINLTVGVPFDVSSKAFTATPTKVTYQSILVHIPLPNVKAPKSGIDLGDVKAGGSASKSVTINNTGEKAAVMTVKSSSPSFRVPTSQVTIEPKGKYELKIDFSADSGGSAAANITILSNDPDSPEQTFKIGANGADVGTNEDDSVGGRPPAVDSGCGCKAAGTTSSIPSWAGFGLLGLGALVLGRRRKSA
jgi:MYXO-CTERM domain-containing protein